jgi:hypothetical protein
MKLSDRGIKTIDYTQGDAELENAYLEAWNAKESKKPAEKQKLIDLAAAQTIINGAECVAKSYPLFFDDFSALGGKVEDATN